MMDLPDDLIAALGSVRSVGAITGAGVSAESGIQTYRGKGGLYDDEEEGDRTVEALSGPTLQRDPARTWKVVAALARLSVDAAPNPAHVALAEIERSVARFTLLTQNVDGLHLEAGSRRVIEIHGNVHETRCMSCRTHDRLSADAIRAIDGVPRCDACGGNLRPDVVLFGEMLDGRKLQEVQSAFYADPPDLVVIAGTTAVFPYIVEPVLYAARMGKLTLEVNPEPTIASEHVGWSLRGRGGDVLPSIAKALRG